LDEDGRKLLSAERLAVSSEPDVLSRFVRAIALAAEAGKNGEMEGT
jgi:hypothetical protein